MSKGRSQIIFAALLICGITTISLADSDSEKAFDQDFLAATMAHYDLTEEEAVDRLARESMAAELEAKVLGLPLEGYAGSWFDGESGKLVVATSAESDVERLRLLDVDVVQAHRSLEELTDALNQARAGLHDMGQSSHGVSVSYIDVRTNQAVVEVAADLQDAAESIVGGLSESSDIRVETISSPPRLSAPLRAANGTRNLDWAQQFGGVYPCSIGAVVEDGYVTAGHCGERNHDMGDVNNQPLGQVEGSTWFDNSKSTDVGYVETVSGWTPKPHVNGYSDGILTVNAKWSGTLEAPIGATVCRYGQTSGGPDCGQVAGKNQTVGFLQYYDLFGNPVFKDITGLTRTTGICTSDGDSGGPHVGSVRQIQGVNVGGQPGNSCPNPENSVWFQPVDVAVDEFNVSVLTAHGANAPTNLAAICPNPAESGDNTYTCDLTDVRSQGLLTYSWSASTGHSSNTTSLWGTCTGQVSVTLTVSNPYGSTNKNYSFPCPTYPIP